MLYFLFLNQSIRLYSDLVSGTANETCNEGYLNVCDLNYNCEPARYWRGNWPSQFIAEIINSEENRNSCCFQLSGLNEEDGSIETKTIKPGPGDFYTFPDDYPVKTVRRCVCHMC